MLYRFLITISLLAATSLVQAGEAGRIVFVTGQVQSSGRAIALGDAVQEGDELVTGVDGYVYLKTVDNGFLILRPGSKARLVSYHIDADNPANTRVKFELLNGVARAISGQGVKQARQNFRFNTPVAAIGVRGTDFTVFTDQQTSRVAVISGGVVVSGFGGACGPEGGGPCEGSASRELFAYQSGQLLQIQKGQVVPRLLRSSGLSPDLSAPPRNDEPTSKVSGSNPVLAASDVSLDPKKNKDLLFGGKFPLLPEPTPLPPTMPEPPAVVVPKAPEIPWGRWQAIADLPADSEALAKLRSGEYLPANIIGSFFISRVKNTEFVMPKEGRVAFGLVNSEAYIRAAGQAPVAATIQNSRLDIDFAARSFTTSLDVVAPGARVDIRAKGDITSKGELISDLVGSNASVRGYLGGANVQEAAYIFSSTNTPALSAFGATRWAK